MKKKETPIIDKKSPFETAIESSQTRLDKLVYLRDTELDKIDRATNAISRYNDDIANEILECDRLLNAISNIKRLFAEELTENHATIAALEMALSPTATKE